MPIKMSCGLPGAISACCSPGRLIYLKSVGSKNDDNYRCSY